MTAQPDEDPRPIAFISHASADTDRIVTRLDKMLCDGGLRTWLDNRELTLGSNLVERIFDQGIGKSDAFIIVLSKNSIDRPWVREELSVAVVQRIAGRIKTIIPLLLDDVEPPIALSHLSHERIPDPSNLAPHIQRIVEAVYGVAPALVAPPPPYAGVPIHRLSGLTPNDERFFAVACEIMLQSSNYNLIDIHEIAEAARNSEMTDRMIAEALGALEQYGYLSDLEYSFGGGPLPHSARIPNHGLDSYMRTYRAREYRLAKQQLISAIANGEHMIIQLESRPIHGAIISLIVDQLENAGHIRRLGHRHVMPLATLRRALQEIEDDTLRHLED